MDQTTKVQPALEYERALNERGLAALDWLRRLLVCWLILQVIMVVNVFNQMATVVKIFGVSWSKAAWVAGGSKEIGMSPDALLLALFAGWAGVSAIRNRAVLPRRWFVAGMVPWGLLVGQGTALLASTWL